MSCIPTQEHGNANTLSRFQINSDEQFENEQSLESVVNFVQTYQLGKLPIKSWDIAEATRENEVYAYGISQFVQN